MVIEWQNGRFVFHLLKKQQVQLGMERRTEGGISVELWWWISPTFKTGLVLLAAGLLIGKIVDMRGEFFGKESCLP